MSEEPARSSIFSGAGVTIGLIAAVLIVACCMTAREALDAVDDGSKGGMAPLATLLGVVAFFVGSLCRLVRGSRSTAWFVVAIISFVGSMIIWYPYVNPGTIGAIGALGAVIVVLLPTGSRSKRG